MKDRLIYPVLGLLIYLSYLTNEVRAQSEIDSDELNELTVDRPGIAETPFTVAPGTFQFETGFDYYSRYNGDVSFLPVVLFRTGLSKSAELRITEKHMIDK